MLRRASALNKGLALFLQQGRAFKTINEEISKSQACGK